MINENGSLERQFYYAFCLSEHILMFISFITLNAFKAVNQSEFLLNGIAGRAEITIDFVADLIDFDHVFAKIWLIL